MVPFFALMKFFTWITRVLEVYEAITLKLFLQQHLMDVVLVRESKEEVAGFVIKSLWSPKDFGWAFVDTLENLEAGYLSGL